MFSFKRVFPKNQISLLVIIIYLSIFNPQSSLLLIFFFFFDFSLFGSVDEISYVEKEKLYISNARIASNIQN